MLARAGSRAHRLVLVINDQPAHAVVDHPGTQPRRMAMTGYCKRSI